MEIADPVARMRSYIQLVATGPELSKSLSREQAEDGIRLVLENAVDPVRSAIFLIALRMKRETDDENLGALDAMLGNMTRLRAASPEVLALADPFNGYLRGLPATPFVPALLAACGLPCYLHGVHNAGPKYGVTPHMVLAAADQKTNRPVDEAIDAIDDESVGWSYLDQAQYLPGLHALIPLRDAMVKRCLISTLEVVLNPVRGARLTHLMTGFVHKAYPPVYQQLARHAGFDSAAIVRGVEGGCVPSLSQLSRYFGFTDDGALTLHKLEPSAADIVQDARSVPLPEAFEPAMQETGWNQTDVLVPVAKRTAELGLDALDGSPGPMQDSLIYAAAIALTHTRKADSLGEGAARARAAINSGAALARFQGG